MMYSIIFIIIDNTSLAGSCNGVLLRGWGLRVSSCRDVRVQTLGLMSYKASTRESNPKALCRKRGAQRSEEFEVAASSREGFL